MEVIVKIRLSLLLLLVYKYSNYNSYMFRPFLVAIIRPYIPSLKSLLCILCQLNYVWWWDLNHPNIQYNRLGYFFLQCIVPRWYFCIPAVAINLVTFRLLFALYLRLQHTTGMSHLKVTSTILRDATPCTLVKKNYICFGRISYLILWLQQVPLKRIIFRSHCRTRINSHISAFKRTLFVAINLVISKETLLILRVKRCGLQMCVHIVKWKKMPFIVNMLHSAWQVTKSSTSFPLHTSVTNALLLTPQLGYFSSSAEELQIMQQCRTNWRYTAYRSTSI
jgi:hypothetical protein